jgi:tetratricopeptide (TPR) repeat protein
MSLKYRQLARIKANEQEINIRLNDGTTLVGKIIDIDENDMCILCGEFERVIALSAIVDVQNQTITQGKAEKSNVIKRLQDSIQNNSFMDLVLQSGENLFYVSVIGLESTSVLIEYKNHERLISLEHIKYVNYSTTNKSGSESQGITLNYTNDKGASISYPALRSTVAMLEQELSTISWSNNQFPQIIKECPVPIRTHPSLGKIWGRALNYVNDRSWRKAAEEFSQFATQKSDSFEACHNAGVCWFKISEYAIASVFFDYGIFRNPDAKVLTAGIIATNQVQYWHKSLDWMLKYLMVSKGVDTTAYLAIDFGIKFGMHRLTVQHVGWALEAQFPMDWKWITIRLAYIAIRYPNLSATIMAELEQILVTGRTSSSDIMRITESLFVVVNDSPALEYRNSQELEANFLKNNPTLDFKRLDQIKIEVDELRKSYKYKDAKFLVEEWLRIMPDDADAKRILRDLEVRLAPPLPLYSKKPSNTSKTSGYGGGSTTYNNAKKAETSGDLEKAITLYKDCIKKKDGKWQSAVMDLAGICLRKEDIDLGVSYILDHSDDLDSIASNNMLGALYFKGGKYEEAIRAYKKVVELKSTKREQVAPLMSIATIKLKQDKVDEAKVILQNILQIQPNQSAAKGLIDSIKSGLFQSQISNVQIDKEGYLNIKQAVGIGTVGIGQFLEAELESAEITGIERKMIVTSSFGLKEINYLLGRARDLGIGKPEQQAQYYISAAKILDELNERVDDRFPESLRRFCAAQADYYAIKNFDVARAYYIESFRLEDIISPQLVTIFKKLLMTFLYTQDEFLASDFKHDISILLETGLKHTTSLVRHGIVFCVLNVLRKNPDIVEKLQDTFQKSSIRSIMARSLSEILNENIENLDNHTLERLIVSGQKFIEKAERTLEEKFNWFFDNSVNAQLIYDLSYDFFNWKPDFISAGVDYGRRDANRIEGMKDIFRYYIRFKDEEVFEEKDNLRNTVNTQIEKLQQDIHQFPTYYSRCYILPILSRWQEVIVGYFAEIASVSKPNLEIREIAKAVYDNHFVSVHLIVSNEQGKSAASGIKLEILPSQSQDYEMIDTIVEFGKTLRSGEQGTVVCQVRLNDLIPAFALHYRLYYANRQGEITVTYEQSIPIRLSQDQFMRLTNPYARWASSNEVTDPKMFFGREQLVGELFNLFCVPGQRKMIVIHGQKRAGKSSILFHVKDRIDKRNMLNDVIVCAFKMSIGDVITSFTLSNFFYVLGKELYRSAKEKLQQYDVILEFIKPDRDTFRDDPFNQFLEYTEELIEQIKNSTNLSVNLLMIIDEFTYVYELIQKGNLDTNFMKAWKALVERRIFSFLLSGIDEMPEFVNAYPNEFAVADLRRVSYLDNESSKDLIEEPVWDIQNNNSRFQERAVQRIQELTGSSAYYIQIFNNQLVEYMNEEKTSYITEADIDAVMRRLTYGQNNLNLASNFDNLTRFKNGEQDTKDIILEGRLLRLIAFLTKNETFAHRDSIFRRFRESEHPIIERLISRLISRDVLKARAGSQQYAFVVDLFKEWLNTNLPYEEGLIHD